MVEPNRKERKAPALSAGVGSSRQEISKTEVFSYFFLLACSLFALYPFSRSSPGRVLLSQLPSRFSSSPLSFSSFAQASDILSLFVGVFIRRRKSSLARPLYLVHIVLSSLIVLQSLLPTVVLSAEPFVSSPATTLSPLFHSSYSPSFRCPSCPCVSFSCFLSSRHSLICPKNLSSLSKSVPFLRDFRRSISRSISFPCRVAFSCYSSVSFLSTSLSRRPSLLHPCFVSSPFLHHKISKFHSSQQGASVRCQRRKGPCRAPSKSSPLASCPSSSCPSSSSFLSSTSPQCPRCSIISQRTPLVIVGCPSVPAHSRERKGTRFLITEGEKQQEGERGVRKRRKVSRKNCEGRRVGEDSILRPDVSGLEESTALNEPDSSGKGNEDKNPEEISLHACSTLQKDTTSVVLPQHGDSEASLVPVIPVRLTVAKQLSSLLHLSATATRRRVFLPLSHLLATFEVERRRRQNERTNKTPSEEEEKKVGGKAEALQESTSDEKPLLPEIHLFPSRGKKCGRSYLGYTLADQEGQDKECQEIEERPISLSGGEEILGHLDDSFHGLEKRRNEIKGDKVKEKQSHFQRDKSETIDAPHQLCDTFFRDRGGRALKLGDFLIAARRVQGWIDHFGVPVRLGYRLHQAKESGSDSRADLEKGDVVTDEKKKSARLQSKQSPHQDGIQTGEDEKEKGEKEEDGNRGQNSDNDNSEEIVGGKGEEDEEENDRAISVLETDEALQRFLSEYYEPLVHQYLQKPLCTHDEHGQGRSCRNSFTDDKDKREITASPSSEKEDFFSAKLNTRNDNGTGRVGEKVLTSPSPCMHRILKLKPCENTASSSFSPSRSRLTLVLLPPPASEWPPDPIAPFILPTSSSNISSSTASAPPLHPEGLQVFRLLSFYKFVPFSSPDEIAQTLRLLWTPLSVLGRVYVAKEGINGQVAIPEDNLSRFYASLQLVPELQGDGLAINLDPWPMPAEEFSQFAVRRETGDFGDRNIDGESPRRRGEEEEETFAPESHDRKDEPSRNHLLFPPPFEGLYIRVRHQVLADGLSGREEEKREKAHGEDDQVGCPSEETLEKPRRRNQGHHPEELSSGKRSREDGTQLGKQAEKEEPMPEPLNVYHQWRTRQSKHCEKNGPLDSEDKIEQIQSEQEQLPSLDWSDCGEELEPSEWEQKLKEMLSLQKGEEDERIKERQNHAGDKKQKATPGVEPGEVYQPDEGMRRTSAAAAVLTERKKEKDKESGDEENDGEKTGEKERGGLSQSVGLSLATCSGRRKKRIVLLDCRNTYETDIGHFKGAVPLGTEVFSESFGPSGAIAKHLKALGVIKSEIRNLRGRRDTEYTEHGGGSTDDSCISGRRKAAGDHHMYSREEQEGGGERMAQQRPSDRSTLSEGRRVNDENMIVPQEDGDSAFEKKDLGEKEDVEVMMYCTGGIRCVKAGAYVKQALGVDKVWRLKGGVLRYVEYLQGLEKKERNARDDVKKKERNTEKESEERVTEKVEEEYTKQEENQDRTEEMTSEVEVGETERQTKEELTEARAREDAKSEESGAVGDAISERKREHGRDRIEEGPTARPVDVAHEQGILSEREWGVKTSSPSPLGSSPSSFLLSSTAPTPYPLPGGNPSSSSISSSLPARTPPLSSSLAPSSSTSLASPPMLSRPSLPAPSTFMDHRSLYIGSLYVFDHRMTRRVTSHRLTSCLNCKRPCDRYINCFNPKCHIRVIQCLPCSKTLLSCCTPQCHQAVLQRGKLPTNENCLNSSRRPGVDQESFSSEEQRCSGMSVSDERNGVYAVARRRQEQARDRLARAQSRTRRATEKAVAVQLRLARLLRGHNGETSGGDTGGREEGNEESKSKNREGQEVEEQEGRDEERKGERGVAREEEHEGRGGEQRKEEIEVATIRQLIQKRPDPPNQKYDVRTSELFFTKEKEEVDAVNVPDIPGESQTHESRFIPSLGLRQIHQSFGGRLELEEKTSSASSSISTIGTVRAEIQATQRGGALDDCGMAGCQHSENACAGEEGALRRRELETDDASKISKRNGKKETSSRVTDESQVYNITEKVKAHSPCLSFEGGGDRRDVLAEMHAEAIRTISDSELQQDLLDSLEKTTEQVYLFQRKARERGDTSLNRTRDEFKAGREDSSLRSSNKEQQMRERHKDDEKGEAKGNGMRDQGTAGCIGKPGGEGGARYNPRRDDMASYELHRGCLLSSPLHTSCSSPSLTRRTRDTIHTSSNQVTSMTTGAWWSDKLQRRVLSMLSRLQKPRSILEIGTFTGLSTLSLAEGLHLPMEPPVSEDGAGSAKRRSLKPDSKCTIVTIERDPGAASIAMQHFARSPYAPYIRLVRGDADKVLLSLQRAMRERRCDEENGTASRSVPTETQVRRGEYVSNLSKEPTEIQERAKCGQGEETQRYLFSVQRLQHRTGETGTNQDKHERSAKKDEELSAKINGIEEDRGVGQSKVTDSCSTTGTEGDDRVSCEDSRRLSLLSEDHHPAFPGLFQLEGQSYLPDQSLCSLALPSKGFDLIFLDADKKSYVQYLRLILHPAKPLLARDGLLIVDNVLFAASRKSGWPACTEGVMDEEEQVHEGPVKSRQGRFDEEEALSAKMTGKQREVQEEKGEETVRTRQSLRSNETDEGTQNRSKRLLRIQEEMKRVRELLSKDERLVHAVLPIRDGISLVTWKRSDRNSRSDENREDE
ncbi:transmembrane protein [Cystoisospora suis]|uniref:Transmembrane protein n=1 Tax=Cystoisospora suis TaxID=483139 RepID=A0A2C6KVR1_9APIC|nr:transmembrane protein [Cystoisospora suis]